MDLLGFDELSVVLRIIPADAAYVALACRRLRDAEQLVRGPFRPRIAPLWTCFCSEARLTHALADTTVARILHNSNNEIARALPRGV
jgi:hypothetical protein